MLKTKSLDRKKNKILFSIELLLAILLSIGCSLIGMSNLLMTTNNMIPSPTDALGHMTKVIYIAEQLSDAHLPSWFPYWYNGAAATQYYVPLSYYIMVPIYWATNNIMLTYKIFCGSVMVIGSMGVWAFCNRKIGRFCGLVGIIAFSLQPILLTSLYREGVVAQGPIFALMPWYFLLILSCVQKPTKRKYIGITILVTLLILSHAMHAYMVCLATIIVFLIFILMKKISIKNFFITLSGIAFSGLLTAFWSVVGATGLENPGIPYLLPEAAAYTTANIQWFLPNGKGAFLYFAIEVSILSLLGIICYLLAMYSKRNSADMKFYGLASLLLTIITAALSFGMKLPGFRFLPLASGLVPGRLLTFTAVTGAISSAYCIYMIWSFPKVKFLFRLITITIIIYMCKNMNPFIRTYPITTMESFETMKEVIENNEDAFDKGRYNWYGATDSSETLFTYLYHYNISYGWNIEGTLQNQVIYNNYIALPIKEYDYIAKEIAFWNIRYVLLNNDFSDIGTQLETELNFKRSDGNRTGFSLFVSHQPSSYYLTDDRNALIVSWGMQGFCIHFPNFVQGRSEFLWDYSEEELLKYKLIYIIEPSIKTLTQKNNFEASVTKLINAGITVIIEPAESNIFDIFNVQIKDEFYKNSPIFSPTVNCPYNLEKVTIKNNSNIRMIRSLYGLDEVYANYEFDNNNIQNAVLGTKKVGNGKVIFAGAHLSQYLQGVYVRNNGIFALNDTVKSNSKAIEAIFNNIFSYYNINKTYLPKVFNKVTEHHWDYNGGRFSYSSEQEEKVTVSVTYTPRWTAVVDGKEVPVGQCEHLVTLILPAGEHTVELHYGTTFYGKIGYYISIAGVITFLLFILLWEWNMKLIDNISYVLTVYLQINDHPKENNSDSSLSGINEIDEAAAAAEKCIIENILRADHADIIGKIKLEQEDKQDFYNTINKNGKQNLYHETIHENGIRFDIIEIEEECNISYEDERIEIEVDKKENTDRILSENVKEVLDIIEASMESGGAVSDYTMNTTSIYKKDAEAVISEAVKNAKNIEKDKNEIQAETTKEITNDRVLQHNYNRNKVYDEYDEILKQAIYAHERSKLQEHYEYLKACVSETKEEDQNQQYNNNMKHVSLFPESINSSPDNYNNGNLSKNINNIGVIDQHQYNKIEANKKNYSIRKNKTFKAAEGSSPFNNIISYKLLNKSLPKGHLAKEQQKKRRKEVLHNKKSRERQKQYFILKRKDA